MSNWKHVHMTMDIAGALRRPDRELSRMFIDDDGKNQPGSYVRDWLKLQLAMGKSKLPIGGPCEGWSDEHGCPGHPCPAPKGTLIHEAK